MSRTMTTLPWEHPNRFLLEQELSTPPQISNEHHRPAPMSLRLIGEVLLEHPGFFGSVDLTIAPGFARIDQRIELPDECAFATGKCSFCRTQMMVRQFRWVMVDDWLRLRVYIGQCPNCAVIYWR